MCLDRATRLVALALIAALAASACGAGTGERACQLLGGFPAQASEASIGQFEELAQAARSSASPEIQAIGEQMASTVESRHALDNLAPGSTVEILGLELEKLRRACGLSAGP